MAVLELRKVAILFEILDSAEHDDTRSVFSVEVENYEINKKRFF